MKTTLWDLGWDTGKTHLLRGAAGVPSEEGNALNALSRNKNGDQLTHN